jgi:uncharacterized membrane protein
MSIERPILKLKLTQTDLLLDRLAWAGLLFLWIFSIASYSSLPSIIPTHFNIKGDVDGYGSKITIWLIPSIVTIIVAGFTVLNKYPHIFNYLKPITPENAERQYALATRLLRFLKLIVVIIFSFIAIATILNVNKQKAGVGIWVLPALLAFIFIPIIIYFYKANKKENS